jgi:hypothetical protein
MRYAPRRVLSRSVAKLVKETAGSGQARGRTPFDATKRLRNPRASVVSAAHV